MKYKSYIIFITLIILVLLNINIYLKTINEYFQNINSICCVFVSNQKYFSKFVETCHELVINGKYKGDICLVIGDDLKNNELLNHKIIKNNNIIIKYFPDIKFPPEFYQVNNNLKTDGRNITKKFQWHKLHLFNTYFKKWNGIFYIDCGMKILDNIKPMLQINYHKKLLAHSDAYPTYERKLSSQFDSSKKQIYYNLSKKYNLNIDYFQTGILLYDTDIIKKNTFNDLLKIAIEYPISTTNEQGIMNIYFNCQKKIWEQIKLKNNETNFYDYWSRNKNDNKYIIVKVKNW